MTTQVLSLNVSYEKDPPLNAVEPQTFFDSEQLKYQYLIQKTGPYVAKMFFLQSKQMKVSGYTGVWYKNV